MLDYLITASEDIVIDIICMRSAKFNPNESVVYQPINSIVKQGGGGGV